MNEGPPAPPHHQTISKSSMVIYFLKLCVCVCVCVYVWLDWVLVAARGIFCCGGMAQ